MNAAVKRLDVICIGRVAVDLYAQQIGSRLEDVASFAKYLGGSSGNVAFGTAIQGLKSAMLARVGDEHNGRFLRETLNRAGVDTEYLITDKSRLTALVMLGIKDQETFPLIFYRDNCADMALTPDDISEEYIASSRALAVTGTHLSHANTRAAVLKALEYARRHGLRTALDIDYRPVLWGLTSLGDGETRFIESGPVTSQLQEVLHLFDLVVGTEEEFHIAGGSTDTLTALKNVRNATKATLVCKRGPMGCVVLEGDIPDSWDQVPLQQGVRVEVLNVLGAGDAFMSGLLRGWLNDEGWEQACRYANACGALVVSRHGCAPAMPTKVELDDYLQRAESVPRPDVDERLNHLHRVTSRRQQWPELCIFVLVGLPAAASLINFVVLTSAASSANSGVFSTSRMLFGLAQDGQAPKMFAKLSKRAVPAKGLTFSCMCLLGGVVMLMVNPSVIAAFTMITTVSAILFMFVWTIILCSYLAYRKNRPQLHEKSSYKMPLGKVMCWVCMAFFVFVLVLLTLEDDTREALMVTPLWFVLLGAGWLFAGKKRLAK